MLLTRKQFNWLGVILFFLTVFSVEGNRRLRHAAIENASAPPTAGIFWHATHEAGQGKLLFFKTAAIVMPCALLAYAIVGYRMSRKHYKNPDMIFGEKSYPGNPR